MKGKVTKTGYRDDSPDRFNDYNVVLSDTISMNNVSKPIMIFPIKNNKVSNPVQGIPGEEYYFPGADGVVEMPLPPGRMSYERKAKGGSTEAKMRKVLSKVAYGKGGSTMTPELAAKILKTGSIYGKTLSSSQKNKFADLAAQIGIDEDGDPIEEEKDTSSDVEEYRRGGSSPKVKKKGSKTTNKNVYTAINELFSRNTMLYGSGGKEFYQPQMKQGGWLDKHDLPKAQDGWFNTLYAKLNPYNWGVPDYSGTDGGGKWDWSTANHVARLKNQKEFMHNNKRYAVKDKRQKENWEIAEETNPDFFKNYALNYLKSNHPKDYEKRYKDLLNSHYRYGNPYVNVEKPYMDESDDYGRAYFKSNDNEMHIYGVNQNPNTTKIDTANLMDDYVEELLHARQLKDLGKEDFIKHKEEDLKRNNIYYDRSTNKWINYDERMYDDPKSIEGVHYAQGYALKDRLLNRDYNLEEKPEDENFRRYLLKYFQDKRFHPYENQDDLRTLQKALSEAGYDMSESLKKDGTYDGIYGEQTKNALANWQKGKKHLPNSVKKSDKVLTAAPTYNKKMGGWLEELPKAQVGLNNTQKPVVDATTPEDLKNMKLLGYPIYTGQKDFYDKFKDAKTFLKTQTNPKGISSPFFEGSGGDAENPRKSWINEGWDGYDESPLEYNIQDWVPSEDPDNPICAQEQCTSRANRAIGSMYFQTGDSFYENPDITKKNMGVTYTTAEAPTAAQQQQYDYMMGDTEFGSLDAWDIVQQAKKKIPKNVLYSSVVDIPKEVGNDTDKDWAKRQEFDKKYRKNALKAKDVWKKYDIPIGSYINIGVSTSRDDIIAGSHTLRVTGYTDEGEPLVADYGRIVPLSKSMYANDPAHDFIAGIVTVPGKEKYTYKWFKQQAKEGSKPNTTPYLKDIKSEKYGDDYKTFHDNIMKEKNYIATKLGIDRDKYDQYAKIALTLGGVETGYGKGLVYNIPLLDKMGESTGVAQVTEKNVADKYKNTLAKYKDDPQAYNAMSALLYVKELDNYKDKWLKSGEKAGERPFVRTDESSLKNIIRDRQGRSQQGYINSDFHLGTITPKNDVFRYTDANDKPREIQLPYKQIWQSDADYEKEVNEVLKKEDPTLRFSSKGDKGERTIYKKTKGNTIPKDLEDFVFYAWQAPNAVAYGDAQGTSTYYKKAKKIYSDLFGQKLAQKKLGGASDWLDEYQTKGESFKPVAESTSVRKPQILKLPKDINLGDKDRTTLNYMYAKDLLKKYNVDIDSSGNILKDIGLPSAAYYNPVTRTINYKHNPEQNPKIEYSHMVMNELPHAMQSDSMGVLPFLKNVMVEGAEDYLFNDDKRARYYNTSKIEGHAHNILQDKLYKDRMAKLYPKDLEYFEAEGKHKYGGWLDDYQGGGTRFGDLRPTSDATRVVIPNLPKKPLTKAEKQEVKQYEIKQLSRDLEKAQEKVNRFERIKAANKAQAEQGFPTTRQEWADQTQAIGDKISLKNIPGIGEYVPDILDVTGEIGDMASSLASSPLRAQQQDSYMPYITGVGSPLLAGALASLGTKNTKEFVNNIVNPLPSLSLDGSPSIKFSSAKDRINKAFKGSTNVFDQIKGELKQGKLNRQSIKKGNEWLKNWIENPITQQKIDKDINNKLDIMNSITDLEVKEMKNLEEAYSKMPYSYTDEEWDNVYKPIYDRLLELGKKVPDEQAVEILELIRDQSKTFKPNSKEYPLLKQLDDNLKQYLQKKSKSPIHQGNWGVSYMHSKNPVYRNLVKQGNIQPGERYGSWISRTSDMPQEKRIGTAIHEGTHDWVPEEAFKKSGMRNIALKNMNPKIKDDFLEYERLRSEGIEPETVMGKQREHQAYLADPTEQHARIMELRHHLGITPGYDMDLETAEKVLNWVDKGGSRIDRRFLNVIDKDPKKLAELFNRFWAVPALIGAGASIKEQKLGGWLDDYK